MAEILSVTKWARDHTHKVVGFLRDKGITGIDKEIFDALAAHIDDEIPGYCDNCEIAAYQEDPGEPLRNEGYE